MRYLILIFISTACFANYWISYPEFQKPDGVVKRVPWKQKEKCESFAPPCYKVDSLKDLDVKILQWEAKSNVLACLGEADCNTKALTHICLNDYKQFINELYTEIYCTRALGLVEDPTLKAAKEASLLDNIETGKAKEVLNLILIRLAADEITSHPSASDKLKQKAADLKSEANVKLVELLNL